MKLILTLAIALALTASVDTMRCQNRPQPKCGKCIKPPCRNTADPQ